MSTSAKPAPSRAFDLDQLGAGLAFAQSLPGLSQALSTPGSACVAVVQAPPGTGKTTLVPPLLANLLVAASGASVQQRIVVTQPRRVAARSAARRLATLDDSRLGDRVGYTVRGERHTSAHTVIEFVTPGILLGRLLADPGLEGVAAVILDEVHERGVETDLLLGILGDVRQLRDDLTLVAMSATVDAPRFAVLLGGDDGAAPVLNCPSALFPLEVRWAPAPGPRMDDRGVTPTFLNHVAGTAAAAHAQALARDPGIDALVFAPGAGEVSRIATQLRQITQGVEVLELHGQVNPREQDRAVSGRETGGLPRIIVSTSLAESSLTVPGVRLVIDSGLSREPRRDAGRGMAGLITMSSSRASAEQRAGRAARLGPGTVVRCYDQKTFAASPAHPMPEIFVTELSGTALTLACWGSPGGEGMALMDAPPAQAMAEAMEVLTELGAVAADGQATPLGQTLATIPADPRLARALLDGAAVVGPHAAAEAVALVAGDLRAAGAELGALLRMIRTGSDAPARRFAQDVKRFVAMAVAHPLGTGAQAGRGYQQEHSKAADSVPAISGADAVGYVVGLAFPDRLARRVPGTDTYLLSSGTRAGLPAGSPLSGAEWLAVAEVQRAKGRDGTGAVIRAAAAITVEVALRAGARLLSDSVQATFSQGKVTAVRERRLGAIVLSTTPSRPTPEDGRNAVVRALTEEGLGFLEFSAGAQALRNRLALLHRELGEPWPDVSDEALAARWEEWLAPEVAALAGGAAARGIGLSEPLRRLLPWPEAAKMAELVPERLQVASGSQVRIDYPAPGDADGLPVVAVKLQECFGWDEAPRLVNGKVPILFHLLSPAGRPLAVTADLRSFFSGPYAQVRAEMRGRYPKHPWPEDPWTARATAKTKAKM